MARTTVFALALFGIKPEIAAQEANGVLVGRVSHAATGNYLSKARVVIEGTTLETFTNDFGEYRIDRVPAGSVQVRVVFTGQSPHVASVDVRPGVTTTHDVAFSETAAVKLNEFVVAAERYKTGQEIAINEERFSVNIKNVVSADQFGEIPSGNVGEFIKYLPGVELEYGGTYIAPTDAFGVSVRGFGAADTAIYIDGVPVASASQASLTTQIGLDMLSINNASRVELIKVATPDMPMNSIGGQINLISKSAFEYSKPLFSWRAYVTVNSEEPNPFERVPGPRDKKVHAGQPGFELSYIRPISKTLGVSLTASSYRQFSENRRLRPEWSTAPVTNVDLRPFGGEAGTTLTNAQGSASLANPFFARASLTDAPRTSESYSASVKVDWKPREGLSIAAGYTLSLYESADSERRVQFRVERPMSWDATHTISYPFLTAAQSANGQAFNPNSSLEMDINSRDKEGTTHTGSIRALYRRGPWDVTALASASTSRASFKDFANGHFSNVNFNTPIGQVRFEDIRDGVPESVTVFDRSGNLFDYTQLANWAAPTIQGRAGDAESLDDVFDYRLDVKRQLDFLPWESFKLAVKVGFRRDETLKKKWGRGTNYRETYIGPALTTADYLDDTYIGQDPGFGFAPQQWVSTYRLYDIYTANPSHFTVTEGDSRENWFSYVGQNKSIKEVGNAWYAQLEGTALKNRLHFVAGLRDEDRKRTGRGPQVDGKWNFIKEADGTLYRNADLVGGPGTVRIDQANSLLFADTPAGNALRADLTTRGIAFPTSVIPNTSLAGAMLQRRALRPVHGESDGKPNYSINAAYNFTDALVGKIAWSRSNGRIPLEDSTRGILTGSNDFNINEAETPGSIPAGTIKVANPNLLPEVSDNWDFALTYYTDSGGKFGASYYFKNIKNFSDEIVTSSGTPEFNDVMSSLGLDPNDFPDWQITTSVNGIGTGKTRGYELEAFQDLRGLRFLGDWGRRINLFATYSHSKRSETNTTRISARPAASRLATGGINIATNRVSLNVRASWRDLTFIQGNGNFTINGTTVQLGTYDPSSTKVDATLNWQFARNYAFYVSGRNIFATGLRKERMDLAGIYPPYAHWDDLREFGVQVTFGIRGTF